MHALARRLKGDSTLAGVQGTHPSNGLHEVAGLPVAAAREQVERPQFRPSELSEGRLEVASHVPQHRQRGPRNHKMVEVGELTQSC